MLSRPKERLRRAKTPFAQCLSSAVALGLAGCQVGPRFQAPDAPRIAGYTPTPLPRTTASTPIAGGQAQTFTPGLEIPGQWWTLYKSAALNALVEQALKANPDIEAAQASLRSVQELYTVQQGGLLPTVSANYNVTRQKVSDESTSPLSSNAFNFTLHTAQVTVGYAPDVFGGLHRQVESAQAQADAQRFQTEATYLTLTAQVVAAAIQQASLAAQVRQTQAIIASDRRALDVLRKQLNAGEIARPDVGAQETLVAQALQTLSVLEKQLAQQNDLIARLTGRDPTEPPPAIDLASLQLPEDLPVSLPSQLVEQRPDIRAAEANLHVASANLGVAIAARLPAFPLSAGIGGQATNIASLFSSGNIFWALTGGVSQPLFQGGQLLHKQRSAQALLAQAEAQYRGTVLSALQNVADTLQALDIDARALQSADAADRGAATTLTATRTLLAAGEVASAPAFVAEQAHLQASLAVIQAQAARYADTAALFQALGGGWWNRPSPVDVAQITPVSAARK